MRKNDKSIETLKPLLDKWNAEFDQMEAMISNSGADPKVDFDEVIAALRQHR